MKIPNPPKTDEATDRHRFYGSISSTFSALLMMITRYDRTSLTTHDELYEKINQLKELIESTNKRINQRTYKEDFDKLETSVRDLESSEISNKTAWATGKTFILGSWAVFTLLFGWAFSMLHVQISDYVETIENNKIAMTDIKRDNSNTKAELAKYDKQLEKIQTDIKNITVETNFIRQQNKSIWTEVNNIESEINQNKNKK